MVGEDAVAALAGEFAGDAGGDVLGHGLVGGGKGHGAELAELGQAEDGALAQGGEDAKAWAARRPDGWMRRVSSSKRVTRRRAVSTAPRAVVS